MGTVRVVKHESSRFASVATPMITPSNSAQRPASAQSRRPYQVNSHDWSKSISGEFYHPGWAATKRPRILTALLQGDYLRQLETHRVQIGQGGAL